MATNEELANKYFFLEADADPPTQPKPDTFEGESLLTPIIDAAAYNAAVETALDDVGRGATPAENKDDFIFIANWWLGLEGGNYTRPRNVGSRPGASFRGAGAVVSDPYALDGPGGTKVLRDILKDKRKKGVDIRVLGWVAKNVMTSRKAQLHGVEGVVRINAFTVRSIVELRRALASPGAKEFPNAIFNTIGHAGGAVHTKLVIIGNYSTGAVGFTGGLDFEEGRIATPAHLGPGTWHDVVVKVQGRAVQHLYTFFVDMWTENLRLDKFEVEFEASRVSSYLDTTAPIAGQTLPVPAPAPGAHWAQGLRTVPNHDYKFFNFLGSGETPKTPAGAENGLFEVRAAWEKAIGKAETFIYIEDQSFWSNEIFLWIGRRIRQTANLRVILVTSGAPDPNDGGFRDAPIRTETLNEFLLKPDGTDLTLPQRNQIRLFKRFGDSATYPVIDTLSVSPAGAGRSLVVLRQAHDEFEENGLIEHGWLKNGTEFFRIVGNAEATIGGQLQVGVENLGAVTPQVGSGNSQVYWVEGIVVHSKTTIIDDEWAMIGSANATRRSLYTDWEHSMSFVDGTTVKEYRKALWNEVFRHNDPNDFDDIQQSLHAWETTWGTTGGPVGMPNRPPGDPPLARYLVPVPIPFQATAFTDESRAHVDQLQDPDSREPWGGLKPTTL